MAVLKTTSPWPSASAPSARPTNDRPSSRTRAAYLLLAGNDHRLVEPVLLSHQHFNTLGVGGGHVLADVVVSDRQLAMASVDEHRQLDRAGPAEVEQRVHRGPCCPSAVDNVVDEHHHLAVDVGHVRLESMRGLAQMAVVAVLAGVDRANRNGVPLQLLELRGEPARQMIASRIHAHQHHLAGAVVALDDLVRDSRQRAADLLCIHDRGLETALGDAHDSTLSSSAMRMYIPLRACRK